MRQLYNQKQNQRQQTLAQKIDLYEERHELFDKESPEGKGISSVRAWGQREEFKKKGKWLID